MNEATRTNFFGGELFCVKTARDIPIPPTDMADSVTRGALNIMEVLDSLIYMKYSVSKIAL